MKQTRLLLFIFGVIRVLRLFPYLMDRRSETATLSRPLLIYSLLLPATVWTLGAFMIVALSPMGTTGNFRTQDAIFYLMVFSYQVIIYLIPLCFLIRSRKLAEALSSLLKFHDKQLCHLIENKIDKRAVFHLFFVIFSMMCFLLAGVKLGSGWLLTALSVVSIFYDTPLRLLVPVLHHAFFRLLSLMVAAAFVPLTKVIENLVGEMFIDYGIAEQPSVRTVLCNEDTVMGVLPGYNRSQKRIISVSGDIKKEQEAPKAFSKSVAHNENTLEKISTPFLLRHETDALLCAQQSIILIERVEATVSGILAPLICALLLSECILNVTFLMSIGEIDARQLFQSTFHSVLTLVRSYLLLDAPEDYRSKVRRSAGVWVKELLTVSQHLFPATR